jgi:uncharacterized RDD family membrane protein YckC
MNDNNDLQLASHSKRALAFVIDDLIVTFIIIVIFWDALANASTDTNSMMYLMKVDLVMPLMLLKFAYQAVFVWYYGATIGKMIMKIRVIDSENWGRVSIFSAAFRAVGRIVSEMFFYIGFAIGFFNEGRKTFHDFAGKTLVVNA